MNFTTLEKVLASPNLPSLPAVALKVLDLTSKPDVSLKQVAMVIENDQAIAAKVLRTINSSFYGLSKRCGSIQQALALLGLQTVKGLVLGFSLAKTVDGGGESEISFDFISYWRRCMYSAAAAKHVAAKTRRCDPDEAFVAALMQDIGMVALWRALGDQYLQTIDAVGKQHSKLCMIERKAFEIDHAAVSGEMAKRWRFPETMVEALRCHHDSGKATVAAAEIARVVELGGFVAATLAGGGRSDDNAKRFCTAANEWFSIKDDEALAMLQAIADLAQQMARVFGLVVGDKPDIDGILSRAANIRTEQSLPSINLDQVVEDEARGAIDEVTGLPERTVFVRDLDMAFASKPVAGGGTGIGLCFVSLDGMKQLNERFGANAGDHALTNITAAIVEGVGRFGRAYRFVGNSFVGLLPKTDAEQLGRIGESIRKKIAESVYRIETERGPQSVNLTVTCGLALCDDDSSGVTGREQLVRNAVAALTTAQKLGPNHVEAFKAPRARAA